MIYDLLSRKLLFSLYSFITRVVYGDKEVDSMIKQHVLKSNINHNVNTISPKTSMVTMAKYRPYELDVRYWKLCHLSLSLSPHYEVEGERWMVWCETRWRVERPAKPAECCPHPPHYTTTLYTTRHYTVHCSLVLVCRPALTGSEPDRPNPNLCPSMEIFSTSPADSEHKHVRVTSLAVVYLIRCCPWHVLYRRFVC